MNLDRFFLQQILAEQHQEKISYKNNNIVHRDQFDPVRAMPKNSWIKVIMGIRRCGKSTLAHQVLENVEYGYVNFDDERLMGVKATDLNTIFQLLLENQPGVKNFFFDEIQNVEGWELFANRLQRQGYQLIISGSNSKLLSKELATHLTGRHVSIHLSCFSFREYLKAKNSANLLESFGERGSWVGSPTLEQKALIYNHLTEYVSFGGFPDIATQGYHAPYLRDLYDKIISRDIVFRYHIRYGQTLKEIALYCFSNLGNRITYQKIKNIFNLSSVHTVKNYLQYLEDAYLIYLVKPFSFKYKEQVRLPRKLYTIDNGLSRSISPKFTDDFGAAMENMVFQELNRRQLDIFYLHGSDYEVDFVIREGRQITQLIQVSYSLKDPATQKREIKALIEGAEQTRCKDLKILTWDEEREEKTGKMVIQIQPLWKWLSMGSKSY